MEWNLAVSVMDAQINKNKIKMNCNLNLSHNKKCRNRKSSSLF